MPFEAQSQSQRALAVLCAHGSYRSSVAETMETHRESGARWAASVAPSDDGVDHGR